MFANFWAGRGVWSPVQHSPRKGPSTEKKPKFLSGLEEGCCASTHCVNPEGQHGVKGSQGERGGNSPPQQSEATLTSSWAPYNSENHTLKISTMPQCKKKKKNEKLLQHGNEWIRKQVPLWTHGRCSGSYVRDPSETLHRTQQATPSVLLEERMFSQGSNTVSLEA